MSDPLFTNPGRIAGLVLAGGQSSRFGANKALALLNGETLAARMARMMRGHCGHVALSAKAPLPGMDVLTLADPPGMPAGPLAGVLAGLRWAKAVAADWLVTAPCDTPLLPEDFPARLVEAAKSASASAAVIASGDGAHPLSAAWRVDLLPVLEAALAHGHPSARAFLESLGAVQLRVADEHLLNINTPSDLERAGQALAKRY
ncbi:MAG TPA: molybdenum cofactor guanylyltransferase [Hyphomonadaceae bacterium]|jgi:molybdopterin-guanine dinucleotide biosynthesis protein A|nr:molybdenum cofactor guanylyltransferase [Hyphomonadaceae bacterium]